jgi:heat shock protein HtpX
MKNSFKTTLLLTALTVFLLLAGGYIGGRNGLLVAIIVAALMNFLSYFYSDRIALALYRARPLTPGQLPHLQHTVKRLAQSAGLPMPKIYVIANESPNAFATGRDPRHASIAVTQGLLNLLRPEELEGVLAHELGHVHNRDILISSIAATLAGAITLLAEMGYWAALFGGIGGRDNDRERGGGLTPLLMIILAPLAAMLIQLAVSRAREYQADTTGARFTGNPHALASALRKLDAYSRRVPMAATPTTAHLFIVRPMLGMHFGSLFSTHPPIGRRIDRLIGSDSAMSGLGRAYDYQ